MKPISKEVFRIAPSAKSALTTALAGLKGITSLHIAGDDTLAQKVQEVGAGLTVALSYWETVVNSGEELYKNRPVDLLNQAGSRLTAIPSLIEAKKAIIRAAIAAQKHKAEELAKKGFTRAEIDQLCPEVHPADIAAADAVVDTLEAESVMLKAFLDDGPRYDTSLLIGTTMEALIGTSEAA